MPGKRAFATVTVALSLSSLGLIACQPASRSSVREVVIPATDYAYQLPADVAAGPVLLRLENRGKVAHEMALGQLKSGMTSDSVMARLATGGDPTDMTDGVVGILIAGPGSTSLGAISADLIPGRTYMMICQFKDADSLPPHIAMGMQASFVPK